MAIEMKFEDYEPRMLNTINEMEIYIKEREYYEDYEEAGKMLFQLRRIEALYVDRALKFKNYDSIKREVNRILGYDAFRDGYKGYLPKKS